jgi:hypothetical protein
MEEQGLQPEHERLQEIMQYSDSIMRLAHTGRALVVRNMLTSFNPDDTGETKVKNQHSYSLLDDAYLAQYPDFKKAIKSSTGGSGGGGGGSKGDQGYKKRSGSRYRPRTPGWKRPRQPFSAGSSNSRSGGPAQHAQRFGDDSDDGQGNGRGQGQPWHNHSGGNNSNHNNNASRRGNNNNNGNHNGSRRGRFRR